MTDSQPTLRWGILATGKISQWFVTDLLQPSWPGQKARHHIVAVGSSSLQKSQTFVSVHMDSATSKPKTYGSYAEVYADPEIDIVYVGTPHSTHKTMCLDAIAAGKHVLCEKPFTLNLAEAREVFAAAEKKGVFVMEGMWTRFFPLVHKLRALLYQEKLLGEVYRTFADFGMDVDFEMLPAGTYIKEAKMGGGSLLDVGIYSLTWGILTLQDDLGESSEEPEVVSQQSLQGGVDVASSFLIRYPGTGRQGVLTSTTRNPGGARQPFCRVEGQKGFIEIEGMPSGPDAFTLTLKGKEPQRFEFERPGLGFFWEADAVALAVKEGKLQCEGMPWRETERVMGILDGIRKRGGAKFAVDQW